MIRDVFNMQVEEMARYLGHSTIEVNDNRLKVHRLLIEILLVLVFFKIQPYLI